VDADAEVSESLSDESFSRDDGRAVAARRRGGRAAATTPGSVAGTLSEEGRAGRAARVGRLGAAAGCLQGVRKHTVVKNDSRTGPARTCIPPQQL
jgi:hypothetical protein